VIQSYHDKGDFFIALPFFAEKFLKS